MPSRFDNNQIKIVVVSASGTLRTLLATVIRDLGFPNVSPVVDIKTCLEVMETETVQWIVTAMNDNADGNALQILDVIAKHNQLRGTKVSILRDSNDDSALPHAFTMGAFSCHNLNPTREACMQEFQKLFQRLETHAGDYALVAADYLADFLLEKKEIQEAKRLHRTLLQVYPGHCGLMLRLAEILLRDDDAAEARLLLQQVKIIDPDRQNDIQSLTDRFLKDNALGSASSDFLAGHYGFKSCLILDSDPAVLFFVETLLGTMGFQEISTHRDPVSALKWLRTHAKPDLVISEWKLPQLPGPVFLYKLRHRLGVELPLIISSDLIKDREAPWLNELGVSRVIPKPIEKNALFQAVLWVLQQHHSVSDLQNLKMRIKVVSKKRDMEELGRLRKAYLNHPLLVTGDRLLMEAQLAYDSACYLHAKKYALDAMRAGADSRESLEILGKTLMQLREYDAALRCLQNVNFLSPFNVSHLCQIAECHLEKGDDAGYEKYIDQARSIDKDAAIVMATEAKAALKQGHLETARKLLQRLKSFKEILAFMNNRAVSMIRVGKHKEGLELYRRAIESLPEGQSEIRSLLHYNLGLGFARINRFEEAVRILEEAMQTHNVQRKRKISSLRNRIILAMERGESLQFLEAPPVTESEEAQRLRRLIDEAMGSELLSRSDYCLHRIYTSLLDGRRAHEMLSRSLAFNARGKIVKDPVRGLVSNAS